MALGQAAGDAKHDHYRGLVLSRDNFYGGVDLPSNPDYAVMSETNVLAVEMECAALFIVGRLRGVQTGAILAVDGNVLEAGEKMETYDPGRERVQAAVNAEILVALGALRMLHDDTG